VPRSRKRAPLLLAGREQLRYRFREIVTAARIIELDRHTHLVPHVVDIVLDRLGRHLDPLRKFGAVRFRVIGLQSNVFNRCVCSLDASRPILRCSLLPSPERFEPAFTGDKGVCVSSGGIVAFCLVFGTGNHIPQAPGQAALHSDWQDGIGE
jgi:hypothetical protein